MCVEDLFLQIQSHIMIIANTYILITYFEVHNVQISAHENTVSAHDVHVHV